MKKIVFLTPEDARYGFTMGGAVQHSVAAAEAEAALREVLADPESGVVVVDERLVEGIGMERFREMERRWFGILLVLPAPEGEAGEDYALALIRRALGYHVKLQV